MAPLTATLLFLLLGSVVNTIVLGWQLSTSRFESRDLRAQNERLLARIASEYHLTLGRPGPPPPIPDLPPLPTPPSYFSFLHRHRH